MQIHDGIITIQLVKHDLISKEYYTQQNGSFIVQKVTAHTVNTCIALLAFIDYTEEVIQHQLCWVSEIWGLSLTCTASSKEQLQGEKIQDEQPKGQPAEGELSLSF